MTALLCKYSDGALVPLGDTARRWAAEELTEGRRYNVTVGDLERSGASHRHYFALIKDFWDSLPDHVLMDFPSPEHLRKRALIETGWCNMADVLFSSHRDAVAASRAIRKYMDDYGIVIVRGETVRTFEAKSQSMKAMGKDDFQKSKDDVLGWIEGLLEKEKMACAT